MRCVKRQKKKIWHFPQYNFINGAVWSEMLKIFSIIQWHFLQYYYYELSLSLSLSSLAMPLSFSNTDLTMPHCQSHLELEIFVNRCFQVVAAIIAVVVVVFFWVVVVGVFFFWRLQVDFDGLWWPDFGVLNKATIDARWTGI